MGEGVKKQKSVYLTDQVEYDNELDKLKKLVWLYSCHQQLSGSTKKLLRGQLATLLAIYLQKGYSKLTKVYAQEVLGVTEASINSLNMEIRNMGYLYKDKGNERINHICDDLKALVEYLDSPDTENPFFIFQFARKPRNK